MAHDHVAPSPVPDLQSLLCFAVVSTHFAFNRIYRQPLKRLGLTYPQYLVLVALWEQDRVSVGQLGSRLALDTNTMTPLLKRLEAIGVLTRQRCTSDERRVIVALTERGHAMRQDGAEMTKCVVDSAGLSAGALERLTRDIHALRTNLEQAAARNDRLETSS